MGKYNLKYKTFDELLAETKTDFESFNIEDVIKPYQLIKVSKRVNYELGLKINKTKNVVLTVEKGRAKLPDDFYIVNYAYVLGQCETKQPMIQGTHVEEVPIDAPEYFQRDKTIDVCATPDPCPTPEPECDDPCQAPEPCGCNTCGCSTWMNCKGQEMKLIQKIKYETRKWTEFYRIKITGNSMYFDVKCPNLTWMAKNTAFIRDGYIYTSFQDGELYLNYEGLLEDEEGNLLVLDHPLINEFYEYAIKERLLENLLANNHQVNGAFIQRIDGKLKMARATARGIVNTMEFDELHDVWAMNRKAMFNKYYKMFI
jgi:hypothetical protein